CKWMVLLHFSGSALETWDSSHRVIHTVLLSSPLQLKV
ncbi:hypothetical protein AVDCRST_MAG94-2125, partial [uncultured Leptolyngbya sp.]